jgi:hypothetical protein
MVASCGTGVVAADVAGCACAKGVVRAVSTTPILKAVEIARAIDVRPGVARLEK